MAGQEGISKRGESLIFDTSQEGRNFTERAAERVRQEGGPAGVDQRRELVAQEIAKEFEKEGEGVEAVRHPWEHTPEEHQEVQELVNIAFEKNLKAAIHKARNSQHYPRNLDLLHDVLTTEMYQLVEEHRLNAQPVGIWVLGVLSLMLLVVVAIILLLAL